MAQEAVYCSGLQQWDWLPRDNGPQPPLISPGFSSDSLLYTYLYSFILSEGRGQTSSLAASLHSTPFPPSFILHRVTTAPAVGKTTDTVSEDVLLSNPAFLTDSLVGKLKSHIWRKRQMGSICLSSAPILRCTSLTRIQNIIIIIPPALEVAVTTSLVFINRDSRRRHLLLSAEGWIYFLLASAELLSQILPAVRENLSLFRGIDTGIGVASFLPLFFYTFFLYLFTKAELVETLPTSVKNVTKLTLITFFPVIVVFNEVASFIGISIPDMPPFSPPASVIIVGFTSKRQEGLWTFFTSLTLALMMIFQITVFCFAFFRLFQTIVRQRRTENQRSNPAHLIKGTGWISGAMNLGAIETMIGFAGGGFAIAFTRRLIRLLSRACLCIGLAKGVDAVEHPRAIRNDTYTGWDARNLISNPRLSTVRQLSPTAAAFHAAPRAPHYLLKRDTLERPMSGKQGLVGMEYFAHLKEATIQQRVTVLYNDGAPTLHLRFSALDLPIPAALAKSRPQSERDVYLPQKRNPTPPQSQIQVEKIQGGVFFQPPQPRFIQEARHLPSDSLASTESVPSTSGAVEIISLPRQMQTLRPARAQMYQAPITVNITVPTTNATPLTTTPLAVQEPMYQQPALTSVSGSLSRTDRSRIQSMSVRSIPDSLQAVRELVGQFPGPPLPSSLEERGGQPQSSWEDTMPVSRDLGSPSDLGFSNAPGFPAARAESDDDPTWGGWRSSPIFFVPADNDTKTTSRGYSFKKAFNSRRTSTRTPVQPLDPFSDEGDSKPLPWRPLRTDKPGHRPFRMPIPSLAVQNTPAAAGVFTQATPRVVSTEDHFNGSAALSEGESGTFQAPQADTSSSSPDPTKGTELARVAEWVNSNFTAQSSKAEKDLHNRSLQNLHERGQSIDNLAIPWPRGHRMEEQRRANSKTPLSRFKSVGKAPRHSTPAPIRGSHSRGSLHLEPIIIPPPNENMPELIQETESGRGVLSDLEVLGMEDSLYVRRGADSYF